MGPIGQTICKQFDLTSWIMNIVLPDTSDEIAAQRTREGEGASISWVIAHLLAYRYQAMNMLGAEKENPYESFMKDAELGDAKCPGTTTLLATWNEVQSEFKALMESTSDEQLLAPRTAEKGPHAEKKLLDSLSFFAWHEAHHMGAVSMIRLEQGRKGTATLVMEAMAK